MAMLVITRGWVVFFPRLQWIRRREFEPSSVQCLLFVAVLSSQNSNDFDLMTLIYWHYPSVVQYMTRMIFIAHYYSGGFFLLFRLVFFPIFMSGCFWFCFCFCFFSYFFAFLLLRFSASLLFLFFPCFYPCLLFRFSAFTCQALKQPLKSVNQSDLNQPKINLTPALNKS